MTTLKQGLALNSSKTATERALKILIVLFTLAISITIALQRDRVESLALYGYPAVFLLSLLGNATLILPAPTFAIIFVAGSSLNPIGVGLAAGLGAALGELTGYLVGLNGQTIVEEKGLYLRVRYGMEKYGALFIFVLAAVPNGFFDIGGVLAGSVRMPVWHFLLAGWLGKSLRFTLLALSGGLLL